jgi:hypothetical protein
MTWGQEILDVLKFWGIGILISIVIGIIAMLTFGMVGAIGALTHPFIGGLLGFVAFVALLYASKYNLMRAGMYIGCESYKDRYNEKHTFWNGYKDGKVFTPPTQS